MTNEQVDLLLEFIGTGKTVVEVGCYLGETTAQIAGLGNKVIAIDPFVGGYDDKDTISNWLTITKDKDKILSTFLNNIKGLDVEFIQDTSENVLKTFNRQVDVIFIDGDHTHKGIVKDIEWVEFVKPKGLLIFHDYSPTFPDVVKVLDEYIIPKYKLIAQETSLMIFQK